MRPIADAGVKDSDTFGSVTGGIDVRKRLSSNLDMTVRGRVFQRLNSSEDKFDIGGLVGHAGLNLKRGHDLWTGALELEHFRVDHDSYRNSYGLLGRWLRSLDQQTRAGLYARVSRLDYPHQGARDARRYSVGTIYSQAFGGAWDSSAFAGLYLGKESETSSGVSHLGYDFYGLRLGGGMKLRHDMRLFGTASVELKDYNGIQPDYLKSQDDLRHRIRVGLDYTPAPDWKVTPSISYTRNDSDIPLEDYERTLFSVTLRRDFN